MEKEKTPASRRPRNDQTQVLDDSDLMEVDTGGAEGLDSGWVAAATPPPAVRGDSTQVDSPHGDSPHGDSVDVDVDIDPPAEQRPVAARAGANGARADREDDEAPTRSSAPPAARMTPAPRSRTAADLDDAIAALSTEPADGEERWAREAAALAASQPTRAALLLCFGARRAEARGDRTGADLSLERAAALAPQARFVAMTRRWLAERRRDRVAALVAARAELPLAGEPLERALLLWQIAALEQHARGDGDAARVALAELVALDPQDLGALLALAALAGRQERWDEAADAWEAAAARTDDRSARAALHTAAAGAREVFLDDPDGARAALERAVDADDGGAATQAAVESLLLAGEDWPDYGRTIGMEAERIGDRDPALAQHERAGDVLWECLGDGPAAAAAYRRAVAAAPDDVGAAGKLAALYEQEGRYPELAGVYEQLAGHLSDPTRRAAVLLRLGTLYESRLDRPDEARRAYRKALEAAPTLAAAAQALAAHLRARGRWADLDGLLLIEADRLTDPSQRAARYAAIAADREAHGGADDAIALYERALSLDPGQSAALDALDRLYRARDRFPPLAALHEQQLAQARDPGRRRALRLTLGALYQERLGAPERAAAHYRAALEEAPPAGEDFAVAAALGRALAGAGQWAEHVEVLERQAALLADEEDAVATLIRAATVIEGRLDDPRRALAAYQRVLERAPAHPQALTAVLRLHRAEARWEDLIAAERRLLATTTRDEEAAAILVRIGQIAEEQLGRPDDAITAHEEALARVPSDRLARIGLERLLRARGRHRQLAELLEDQAGSGEPAERARLLVQAALLRELHPDDADDDGDGDAPPAAERPPPAAHLDAARVLHERALGLVPDFPPALWGLHRIGERSRDWPAAAVALEALIEVAEDPIVRARLQVRLARLAELRLDQASRAAALLGDALEVTQDTGALLDRLRAALGAEDDDPAPWLERAAQATTDPRLGAGLRRMRAASIELDADADAGAAAHEAALAGGADPRGLDGLARNLAMAPGAGSARGPGQERRLAEALAARARQLRDPPTRALLLGSAGSLFEEAGASSEAEQAYGDALAAATDFLPALAGRKRLRERAGDWAGAAALAAEMGGLCRDPSARAELLEEAARLSLERLGDLGAAAQHYRAVLAAHPGHPGALARTLEILEQSGDWAEAVAVLSEQVDQIRDDRARADLLGLRARILAERLGDSHAAIADLERAARMRADTPELFRFLAELHESSGHWADAALAFERLAAAEADPAAARAARLAQARIWIDAVPDYPRAQRILEQVVEADPRDREALGRLAEVALRAGDGPRAADVYRRLAEDGVVTERALTLMTLADLQAELGDEGASGTAAAAAFDLIADAPEVAGLLEEHLRSRGDLAGYVTLSEAALVRMALRAPGALPLRLSLARVLRAELGEPERALEHLQQASRGHPRAATPRIALAEALADRDPDAAMAELRRIIEADPTEAGAYAGLAAVCRAQGWTGPGALMSTASALCGGDPVPREVERQLAEVPLPPARSLPPEEALRHLVGPSQSASVREILDHLDPYLPALFPDGQELVAVLQPLSEAAPAASVARAIGSALAVSSFDLLRGDSADPLLLLSEPRALTLSPLHLEREDGLARTRFDAAYALSRLAAGSAVGHVLEPDRVQALLRIATDPGPVDPAQRDLRRRLHAAMPRRARKDLERVAADVGVIDQRRWAAWEQEERRRARRAGVLFARDLRAVARSLAPEAAAAPPAARRVQLAQSDAMIDALRFAASEACWALCFKLFAED